MTTLISKTGTTCVARIHDIGEGTLIAFVDVNSPLLNSMQLMEILYIDSKGRAYIAPIDEYGHMQTDVYRIMVKFQAGEITETEFKKILVGYATARKREQDKSASVRSLMEKLQQRGAQYNNQDPPRQEVEVEDVHIGGYL